MRFYENSDHVPLDQESATETPANPETTYGDDPGASLIEQVFAQQAARKRDRMYPASNHNEPLLKKDRS